MSSHIESEDLAVKVQLWPEAGAPGERRWWWIPRKASELEELKEVVRAEPRKPQHFPVQRRTRPTRRALREHPRGRREPELIASRMLKWEK